MDFARYLKKGLSVNDSFLIEKWPILSYVVFAGFFSIILVACNSAHVAQQEPTSYLNKKEAMSYAVSNADLLPIDPYAETINNILLGELYSQFNKPRLSAKYYKALISDSEDLTLIRRATMLAASNGQNKEALDAAKKWIRLSPDGLESRQYYALLLLRNNDFETSIDQMQKIRLLIERSDLEYDTNIVYSKGLKFIGSMLNIESYHENALQVFQKYIVKYGQKDDETQQYLILSSLAMNAEKYNIVLSSLNAIDDEDLKRTSKITLMKVKALRESNKIDEAIIILKSFVDQQDPSDSTRLQLVRLMILNNQKKTARPYLKELVNKYPDNNDLLKSLIALEIDQSHFKSAKNNIKKLNKHANYHSDAAYFMGEVAEAEGDIQSALKSYQKVINGSLQQRAKKKIIKLKGTFIN